MMPNPDQQERWLIYCDERDWRRGHPYWRIRNGDAPGPGARGYHTEWVYPEQEVKRLRELLREALEAMEGDGHRVKAAARSIRVALENK